MILGKWPTPKTSQGLKYIKCKQYSRPWTALDYSWITLWGVIKTCLNSPRVKNRMNLFALTIFNYFHILSYPNICRTRTFSSYIPMESPSVCTWNLTWGKNLILVSINVLLRKVGQSCHALPAMDSDSTLWYTTSCIFLCING